MFEFGSYQFPQQRVISTEKDKPEWYAICCDWIIGRAVGLRNTKDLVNRYRMIHNDIPDEFYKKILNPYNATNEGYVNINSILYSRISVRIYSLSKFYGI